jgi:FlaA1/EpsC-like NDP-sugar epimerase
MNLTVSDYIRGKRILVTGCCGTIGSQLVEKLAGAGSALKPAGVCGLDINESGLFLMTQEYRDFKNINFALGDVRDRDRLGRIMRGIDVVFHTAAYKHVELCERSPMDAVMTNVLGVQNVISAAQEAGVATVVLTSSDKAVNPTNVMGACKLLGEKLFTAAAADGAVMPGGQAGRAGQVGRGEPSGQNGQNGQNGLFGQNGLNGQAGNIRKTVFASVRFGNVLGSRGSVLPLFISQVLKGGPVTITDPQMTRFVMTPEEAASLVLKAASMAAGGEVFVTKMLTVRVGDLARAVIEELAPSIGKNPPDIEIKIIGPKAGEKFHEELMSGEEVRRAFDIDDYFVILPAFTDLYAGGGAYADKYAPDSMRKVVRPYVSNTAGVMDAGVMDKDALRLYLRDKNLLHGVLK